MLSLFFAVALAATPTPETKTKITCTISENGSIKKDTHLQFPVTSGDTHGALNTFDITYAKGWVSLSRGFLVMAFNLKDASEQMISFYGDALSGHPVGGTFFLPDQKDSWIQAECQLEK
ncbi:MAG: hypothetical protein HUU57_05900 [Bdellovibrio sp.]|nr:hypothetical protein [Bdellovibrio sp.]